MNYEDESTVKWGLLCAKIINQKLKYNTVFSHGTVDGLFMPY